MSPQFVDFDADGKLDIVAGIFDGSPHLVRGTDKGWGAPEQILDQDGNRIVFNQFWNFDTKKWDSTKRHDAPGHSGEGHLTSAIAFDVDGDGDLDLVLGDHSSGRVHTRTNIGTARQPRFSTVNEPLRADGKPIDVPGTVATLRLVDWDRDGRLDLACGSMGDAYGNKEGGGVWVFPDRAEGKGARFGAPIQLLERSKKGAAEPTRPDSGLYMDFGDHDGDGDLDMVVGGYSHWTPKPRELSAEETKRVGELKAEQAKGQAEMQELEQAIEAAVKDLTGEAAEAKRNALFEAKRDKFIAIAKRGQALQQEIDLLVPGAKRMSFVWLYENTGVVEATAPRK